MFASISGNENADTYLFEQEEIQQLILYSYFFVNETRRCVKMCYNAIHVTVYSCKPKFQ